MDVTPATRLGTLDRGQGDETPGACCRDGSVGAVKGTLAPEIWGPRFASEGPIPHGPHLGSILNCSSKLVNSYLYIKAQVRHHLLCGSFFLFPKAEHPQHLACSTLPVCETRSRGSVCFSLPPQHVFIFAYPADTGWGPQKRHWVSFGQRFAPLKQREEHERVVCGILLGLRSVLP